MLSAINLKKLEANLNKIEQWKLTPHLNHGDLRLKNVIVNDKAKIVAILDWENCISNITPLWDFSIALHDIGIDAKQKFLEGYGLSFSKYRNISFALKSFNILNYTDELEKMAVKKQHEQLQQYRLRLNGYFDLYSL